MKEPLFTVVIPTIGRPTLARTLESIRAQIGAEDAEIIVVADTHGGLQRDPWDVMRVAHDHNAEYREFDAGVHDTGSPQLHLGYMRAAGRWIANCGDDDVYEPDAFRVMNAFINAQAQFETSSPLMFKVELHPAPHRGNREPVVLWDREEIAEGHVTGQGFVCPNDPIRMGRWVNDWTFMRETVALHSGQVMWRQELIARCY